MTLDVQHASSVGLILLAAGNSARMGYPKQLLRYNDRLLITHMVEVALASQCQPIVVVLGAYAEAIEPEINRFPIQIIHNPNWSDGMGSSVQLGVKTVCVPEAPEAIILMLCDQPFVSAQRLDRLIRKYQTSGKPIIASSYVDEIGVPALFSQTFYAELMHLKSNAGAKQLLLHHRSDVAAIDFPEGAIDLDTPTDYQQFLVERSLSQ